MTFCLVCPEGRNRVPHRGLVCEGCRSWLRGVFGELPGYVDELLVRELVVDDTRDVVAGMLPAASIAASRGARVSGTKERSTPISLNVVDLTATARYGTVHDVYADQIGEQAVLTILDGWVRDIRQHRGRGEGLPLLAVGRLVDWLQARLDDACDDFEPVADMAADLRHLRGVLRAHLGLGGSDYMLKDGPCPKCDRVELFQQAGSDRIECGNCPMLLTIDEYDRWTKLSSMNLVHLRGVVCEVCGRENMYRFKKTAMSCCGWCETHKLTESPPPDYHLDDAQERGVGRVAA